jgi:hypothetical protein
VSAAGQNVQVGAGKMLEFGPSAAAQKFDTDDTDSLDNWSRRRGELMAMANVSAANRVRQAGLYGGVYGGLSDPCYGSGPMVIRNLGSWGYNPYYGLGTYIPCNGSIYSPYGYRYWSPMAVYRAWYAPRPVAPAGGFGGFSPSYPTMGATSGGYSGTMSAPAAVSAAPAAASVSGSTAASSAGGASVGHGSGGGGGRGH